MVIVAVIFDLGAELNSIQYRREPRFKSKVSEATDLETIISDLLDGQYTEPVRVVGFNVAERWARDVSEDVADEIRRRCDMQMREVPAHLEAFVERHENRRQLTLRLV